MTMFIGTSRKIMGQFAISGMLKIVAWIATAIMGAAAADAAAYLCSEIESPPQDDLSTV